MLRGILRVSCAPNQWCCRCCSGFIGNGRSKYQAPVYDFLNGHSFQLVAVLLVIHCLKHARQLCKIIDISIPSRKNRCGPKNGDTPPLPNEACHHALSTYDARIFDSCANCGCAPNELGRSSFSVPMLQLDIGLIDASNRSFYFEIKHKRQNTQAYPTRSPHCDVTKQLT